MIRIEHQRGGNSSAFRSAKERKGFPELTPKKLRFSSIGGKSLKKRIMEMKSLGKVEDALLKASSLMSKY